MIAEREKGQRGSENRIEANNVGCQQFVVDISYCNPHQQKKRLAPKKTILFVTKLLLI